ncbi:MAG: hypothetical protein AKCLJLPJ_00040 [Fimbriimonadales bacterium]|nr:MAG: hypothetical protein EDM73_00125 [Armatimonadota bacterium]MBV6501999.1 hypothetical protein [Fimbriimonadales bacterium]MCE7898834.1 hypothetical protein [Armatimonadetes bacterium ATM1]MDL1928898.1 hypothetical protein [Fimbriimonadia bacterium ATM]MBC6969565.1 hypothetical protein [Armatimonadota bacterium]
MSYDFYLAVPREGEDADEMMERICAPSPEASPDTKADARRRELAEALVMSSPKLELFLPDPEEYAKQMSVSLDEAKRQCNNVELNVPEDDPSGIQIEIYEDGAMVTIPYWHDERASEFMQEVWGYLQVIERNTEYKTYDPQLDRWLDLSSDIEEVTSRYRNVVQKAQAQFANQAQPKKPWWKFW